MPVLPAIRTLRTLMCIAALTSPCTGAAPELPPSAPEAASPQASPPPPETVPVIRQGRYTLVEIAPEAAQRHPLRQIVEVSIPPTLDTNVGDALRHVLQRSGYRLCETQDAALLYDLPLPAAHLHLGPMTLRNALLTLAGPAWELSVDEVFRRVCFLRRMPESPAPEPVELPDPPPGASLAGERP
jgi:type IV pili sensor histidine kinase/response regulator